MSKSEFASWASAPPSWSSGFGNDFGDTVLFSKVLLARNLLGVPFPHHASSMQQKKSLETLFDALRSCDAVEKNASFRLTQLTPQERAFLMERQLVPHLMTGKEGEVGLVVSSGETLSMMINDEDHMRGTSFRHGLALSEAWGAINELDDDIATKIPLSYNSELGYLTASPANIGTGLRASCLLHLPALVLTGKIQDVVKEQMNSGMTLRGFYGDGSIALGDLFQISNARTLGQGETQIIKEVEQCVKEVAALEKREEENLNEAGSHFKVDDQIYRSFGTLQWARMLDFVEGMKHVSLLRLGIKLGKDLPVKLDKVTRFFFMCQPVHLQIRAGRTRQPVPDEVLRADFFRNELKKT